MATNTDPIYPGSPDTQWSANVTAANAAMDGTGVVNLLYSAGIDGAKVLAVNAKPKGTNVATVARFFLNNGGDPNIAANNSLIEEMTLPATTASAISALIRMGMPLYKEMKSGHKIYVTLGTAVAAGWQFHVDALSYTKL